MCREWSVGWRAAMFVVEMVVFVVFHSSIFEIYFKHKAQAQARAHEHTSTSPLPLSRTVSRELEGSANLTLLGVGFAPLCSGT